LTDYESPASPPIQVPLERAAGNEIWILPLDTGCHFSSGFVMIQADAKLRNPLICKPGWLLMIPEKSIDKLEAVALSN
jgi:hypothetical protein